MLGNMTQVYIPAVNTAIQQADPNLEPQFIQCRSANAARVFIDSQKPFYEFAPNDINISTAISVNSQPEDLFMGTHRWGIVKFDMFWQPANVNERNSHYEWILYDDINVVEYRFAHTIVTGQYTLQQVMDQIASVMTSDADSVGLTGGFNVVYDSNGKISTLVDNIPDTTFKFDSLTSSLVYNGASLLAIPFQDTKVASLMIGPSRMLYSRYVDVVSRDINQFTKNPNLSVNKVSKNVILRQYLDKPNSDWTYSTDVVNVNWINWNSIAPLSVIKFQLYDEYGNLFYYLPAGGVDRVSTPTLNWTCELILEN